MLLVKCALMVANASIVSEVRRLAHREEENASEGIVRLLTCLLGPMGEGGRVVVGLGIGGLCVVSEDDQPAVYAAEETLDDAKTSKSGTADIVVLYIFKDCRSRSHVRVRVKELRPVQDCLAWIGEALVGQAGRRREVMRHALLEPHSSFQVCLIGKPLNTLAERTHIRILKYVDSHDIT